MAKAKKPRLAPRKPPQLSEVGYRPTKPTAVGYVAPDEDDIPDKSGVYADIDELFRVDDVLPVSAAEDDEDDPPPVKKSGKKAKVREDDEDPLPKIIVPKRRVVTLDTRKLTKKDNELLKGWSGKKRGGALDTLMSAVAASAKAKFGQNSVYVGSELDALIVGIPVPSLAFEFLIAQDCFPLGLVLQLVAKPGVGKSSLCAEFGRWFDAVGGGMALCEAESKFNPFWYQSIMGDELFHRMPYYRCDSVEDWQRKLTYSVGDFKSRLLGTKEAPGPGRTIPVLHVVDSIMGKASEETQESILGKKTKTGLRGTTGEGAASRGFPIEALKITRYMRTFPGELDSWPFSLVLVNHLRIQKDDMGNLERNKAGGEQVNFQESFELELKKIGGHKKMIVCADFTGYPVQISCEKNSFGPTHNSIQSRILWWEEEDPETGDWKQRTIWDWNWSIVHLLNNLLRGEKASPRIKKSLQDMDFHLECPTTSDIENTAWSKTMGVAKNDAISWSEMGKLIQADEGLKEKLRKALCINRRPYLAGDYRKQVVELAEKAP